MNTFKFDNFKRLGYQIEAMLYRSWLIIKFSVRFIAGLFIFLAFSLFGGSCKNDLHVQATPEVRDIIIKEYLSMADTLAYHDTTSLDFKLLRAYSANDTVSLKKLVSHFKAVNTKTDWEFNLDSCIVQTVFEDIDAEEKYRFSYSYSFCSYTTSLTIVKYKDSTILNTIVYQYAWDTIPCKIIDQSSISIDSLSWDKFQTSLEVADFWGLKADNGKHGTDGSTLTIYGYKQGTKPWQSSKSNFVSRWNPAPNSIMNSFFLLLKCSKTKKGCVTVL